jgi:2,3-bisphosphoglycerate-independent phosphoglycerate mutase
MKYVIVHAGGMAHYPQEELGGRTPLQVAATPHLDRLAQSGELGQLIIPAGGVYPGGGLIGTAILGYDPKKFYPGPTPAPTATGRTSSHPAASMPASSPRASTAAWSA